ncbi:MULTISPECIES: hypothetical protein [unclassified Fictibacillus]|uniref:hypothetical protein n=1 Tax=unclassified Fictibacillus TaxID=2644029 RepID=UPI0018CE49C0|nr:MULTISPECIES: hypothetical protein [unclassified Fictibacillus]MBH0162827.1 hypothetical protein [Fictibacillus sp. 26RED30]MBH0171231.1 hypothetical protein [Fictibacillus sp. 18YEL24]
MIIMSFLPILIVFIIVAFGIGVMRSNTKLSLGTRKIRWILGGYTMILAIATVISLSILPNHKNDEKIATAAEMSRIEDAQTKAIDNLYSGNVVDLDKVFSEKKKWSFPFNEKSLDIVLTEGETGIMSVFAERKSENDGEIEATYHVGKSYIDGVDFTDKVHSPELLLNGQQLTVNNPALVTVSFSRFSPGFAYSQFSKGGHFTQENRSSVIGRDFILLKVPNNIEINGDISWINE